MRLDPRFNFSLAFLQDVFENDAVKLDHLFTASLVSDIIKVSQTYLQYITVTTTSTTVYKLHVSIKRLSLEKSKLTTDYL